LKDQNRYPLSDQKWISNPTQVLSPNSPSNEAELPLNQRHLAMTKIEKDWTQKPKEKKNPKPITREGELEERAKMQFEDITSPKQS
jgi:hypothetical protein